MNKTYLFRKGGKFNPIKRKDDWIAFVYSHKNCYMYIYNKEDLAVKLNVWSKMKENNIVIKIVEFK